MGRAIWSYVEMRDSPAPPGCVSERFSLSGGGFIASASRFVMSRFFLCRGKKVAVGREAMAMALVGAGDMSCVSEYLGRRADVLARRDGQRFCPCFGP
jgi:hypothetical protein